MYLRAKETVTIKEPEKSFVNSQKKQILDVNVVKLEIKNKKRYQSLISGLPLKHLFGRKKSKRHCIIFLHVSSPRVKQRQSTTVKIWAS